MFSESVGGDDTDARVRVPGPQTLGQTHLAPGVQRGMLYHVVVHHWISLPSFKFLV